MDHKAKGLIIFQGPWKKELKLRVVWMRLPRLWIE